MHVRTEYSSSVANHEAEVSSPTKLFILCTVRLHAFNFAVMMNLARIVTVTCTICRAGLNN